MYKIYNERNKREKNRYIILTQASNLYEKETKLLNSVRRGSSHKYTWGKYQEYFYKTLRKNSLPCHYFIELLGKDYVIFKGLNFINRSYFIEDLVISGIIPYRYRDSILIAINEDFTINSMDERLIIHLNDKLISELISIYDIKRENILYLDNILMPGWKKSLELHDLKYDIRLQNFLSMEELYTRIPRYDKGFVTFR